MTPLLLPWLLGRRVRPLDRVADARGRHVVRIRTNTRRTRWTLKKTDVNANALHAADARFPTSVCFLTPHLFSPAPSLPSLYHDLSFTFFICCLLPFLLASRGAVLFFFFLPPRFWVFTCTIPSHTRHSKESRTMSPHHPTPHDNDELHPNAK